MVLRKNLHMPKMLIITCVTAAVVAGYLGWVFYSRWRNNQAVIERLKAPVEARNRAFIETYGSGLKILAFYAVPSTIHRGETTRLCYSVANAGSVRIEPPPEENVWPSLSRCVPAAPQADTNYRLTAKDNKGNSKTADLTVTVK